MAQECRMGCLDMQHKVFISYASEDKPIADQVCQVLENDGIPCWIAPRDIAVGAVWAEVIVNALDVASVFTHSAGNPFFILETIASLTETDAWHALDPGLPLPIPSSIADVIRQRTETLSVMARTCNESWWTNKALSARDADKGSVALPP